MVVEYKRPNCQKIAPNKDVGEWREFFKSVLALLIASIYLQYQMQTNKKLVTRKLSAALVDIGLLHHRKKDSFYRCLLLFL